MVEEANILSYIEKAKNRESLTCADLLAWLRLTYKLLDSIEDQDKYNIALCSICQIADIGCQDAMVQSFLSEVIVKSRVFLYRDMVKGDFKKNNSISLFAEFAKTYYTDQKTGTDRKSTRLNSSHSQISYAV